MGSLFLANLFFPFWAVWKMVKVDERPIDDNGRTSGALDTVFG